MRDVVIRVALAAVVIASGGSVFELHEARAQGSATVGSLRGLVRDKATGEPVAGATVVAISPALQGEQITLSDETGQYFIASLPPGIYTLTIYYADAVFTRSEMF